MAMQEYTLPEASINDTGTRIKLTKKGRFDCYINNDIHHSWFITSPLDAPLNAMHISFRFKDQGWGNLKGSISISFLKGSYRVYLIENAFNAEHHWIDMNLSFTGENTSIISWSEPGDRIEILYKVGGGGGHSLHVENFKLELDFVRPVRLNPPVLPQPALLMYGYARPTSPFNNAGFPLAKVQGLNAHFYLTNAYSGEVLTEEDGAVICAHLEGTKNQKWRIEALPNNAYAILNVLTNNCLDKCGSSLGQIMPYPAHYGANQQWALTPHTSNSNYYCIENGCGGALDVFKHNSIMSGILSDNYGGEKQLWRMDIPHHNWLLLLYGIGVWSLPGTPTSTLGSNKRALGRVLGDENLVRLVLSFECLSSFESRS